jgi:hypothetical protein
LRKGAFSESARYDSFDPNSTYFTTKYKTTNVMFKFGLQWRFKFMVFEIGLPMGIKWISSSGGYANGAVSDNYTSDTRFVIIPTFQFGIKL